MSHEVRTPLNAIVGFADLLRGGFAGEMSPKQIEYIESIHKGGDQLNALVDDFMDYVAVTRGEFTTEIEELSAHALINYVLTIAEHHARKRNITLHSDLGDDFRMLGDSVRARQCLTNIVDNAIKYSEQGTQVTISARPEGEHGHITVSDLGDGLSEAEIELALMSFGQVKRGGRAGTPGLGLGLPLTLHLMQRQDGRLDIKSEPGVGSTFSLVFPLPST